MTKLLINEHPLMVLPSLASKIGLNEAIILQQVHYWITQKNNSNFKDGRVWVYNSYNEWSEQFPFWSERTIRRAISSLEESGLLISKNYNQNSFNKTKWYTINYKQLEELEKNKSRLGQIGQIDTNNNFCTDMNGQFDQTSRADCIDDKVKLAISYIDTETTSKTTTKTNSLYTKVNNEIKERELIKIWNEVVEEGKKEITITADRSKILFQRFEKVFNSSLEKWRDFCIKISSSKFLMGEVTSFRVSFDWALEPKSIVKILDGDYGIGDRSVGVESKVKSITEEDLIGEIKRTDYPEFWKQIQESLLIGEGRATYISWFRNLEFLRYEEGILELKAPTKFIASQLEQQFTNAIKRAASKFLSEFKKAKIIS